jgi:hypothetical protein
MEELEWPHGFFDVQVDTNGAPEKHTVQAIETPTLRSFHRIAANADDCRSVEELEARVEEKVAQLTGIQEGAVIELVLAGVAEFRRQDVPLDRLKASIELRHKPLIVRVRNLLAPPGAVSSRHAGHVPRAVLEREIVEKLMYQQAEIRGKASAWAQLALEVKNMAAEKQPPASIVDHIQPVLRELDRQECLPTTTSPEQLTSQASRSEALSPTPISAAPSPGPAPDESHRSDLPAEVSPTASELVTIAGELVDGQVDLEDW